MGNLSATDRAFTLDIIADSTTAPANLYEILETKLPANSTDGILKIKVKNSTILDEASVKLRVRINGGAAFVTGNEEYAEYTLEWTNQVIAPASWTYFGAIFCVKKSVNVYKLIVEVTGMSVFGAAEYRALTVAGAEAIGYMFGNYVKQWNLDHPDDPKLHNDGTEIDPVYYNKAKYD